MGRHVVRVREKRMAYRILVESQAGRIPLGRSRLRWRDNIKMDLREMEWGDMD
jgi:hypothetical protein